MTILITIIVLAIITLLGLAASKPDKFRIQRATVIHAPAEKIFPFINDLKLWSLWSPWEKMDPAMKKTVSGAAAGVGAVHEWEGPKTGSGRMEIIESAAPAKVGLKLDFFKPMKAQHFAEFTLVPKDGGTEVTWAMFGSQPFIGKIFSIFCSVEKICGPQFEQGLGDLKATAEK